MQKPLIKPMPTTLITGFLGAGKTTYLNHVLEKNKQTRYAIIENEFGERGIDNDLILRPDESIIEINSGCLCCTLNDDLYDILNELFERRDSFDEVIIEATGVADPSAMAQPFLTHPLIRKHFPLQTIICLVDAQTVLDRIEQTEEALQQIVYSDILFINKTDLVSDHHLSLVEEELQQINPLAKIYRGNKENIPSIDPSRFNDEKLSEIVKQSGEKIEDKEDLAFPLKGKSNPLKHKHTKGLKSLTFTYDQPFDYQVLHQQLFVYMAFQSKGLYRVKGFLWLADEEHQFLLQSAGKQIDIKIKRAWEKQEKKQSTIVFIGKDLQRPGLDKMLRRALVSAKVNQ